MHQPIMTVVWNGGHICLSQIMIYLVADVNISHPNISHFHAIYSLLIWCAEAFKV